MSRKRSARKPHLIVKANHIPQGRVHVHLSLGTLNRWGGGTFDEGGTLTIKPERWPFLKQVLTAGAHAAGLTLELSDLPQPADEDDLVYLQYEWFLSGRLRKVLYVTKDIAVEGDNLDKLSAFREYVSENYLKRRPDVGYLTLRLESHANGLTLVDETGPLITLSAPIDRALAALKRAIEGCANLYHETHPNLS